MRPEAMNTMGFGTFTVEDGLWRDEIKGDFTSSPRKHCGWYPWSSWKDKGPLDSSLIDKSIRKNTNRKLEDNFISLSENLHPRQARDLSSCHVERYG